VIKNVNALILGLSLIFVLSACSKSPQPYLKYIPENGVILAFGDSLTYGVGAPEDQSYPATLEKLIHRKVINAGIPGLETAEADILLIQKIDSENPNLIILCLGGNDMLRRRNKEKVAQNLQKMIEAAVARKIDVILVGVPNPDWGLNSPGFYKDLAKKYNIPLENEILPKLERNNQYKSDPIHLNAKGYQMMADSIATLLKKYGAVD
jgi:lysophospholipase L1-like esterase